MQVADKIAAKGREEKNPEERTQQRDKKNLEEGGAVFQSKNVDRRHGENRTAGDDSRSRTDRQHVHIFQQRRGAALHELD